MLSACPACLRCQSSQYWSWANVETHEQDWQPAAAKMLKATKGMPEILPRGRKWERSLDEALGTLATFCWSHTWKRRKTRSAYTYVYIYIYLYVEALLPKHKQCLQAWFGLSLAAEASRASCKEHRTIKLFACPLFRYRPAWLGFTAQQNWFGLAEKTLAKCCVPGSENQKQSGKNLKFTLLIWRRQRNLAGALG